MTATRVPPRAAQDQKTLALDMANQVRFARADLHRIITASPSKEQAGMVARLIVASPACVDRLSLRKMLKWIDRWGDLRVERLLARLEIGQRHDVLVGELTPRQRERLSARLGGSR